MMGIKAGNGGRLTALDGLGRLSDSVPSCFLACVSKVVMCLVLSLAVRLRRVTQIIAD